MLTNNESETKAPMDRTRQYAPYPNESILQWAQKAPDRVYLKQPINRQYKEYTFAKVTDKALRLVSALRELGLEPGDKIALVSKNCAEWFITDLALMLGDYVSVPVFPTAANDTITHCIEHSESKACICGKLDNNEALTQVLEQHPDLISIAYDYDSAPKCQYDFNTLINDHQPSTERFEHHDDKLMSIVYTSGTSGLPKGAMLTYGAFSYASQAIVKHIGISESGDRLISYLPLAHITERVYVLGSSISAGAVVGFSESLESFVDDVKNIRPTLFISVPRLWTLFHQRILEKMPQRKLNLLLKIPFINNIVRKKIVTGLGLDQARVLGSGSAPIPPALIHWYQTIGMDITEAWGMTETFAYSTINYPFRADKIGTVGKPGLGIEMRIAEDGEIMINSPAIFSGYYKNEEASAEAFTESWFHTGDIGSVDSDGYFTIEGRKKDSFKTAKGKFVSPVPIENKLLENARVEMICLIGLGLPAPIVLAVPERFKNFDKKRYARKAKEIINRVNQDLESHEKIKGVLMVKDPWTIENGILTPTLKIKRHVLEKKYHDIGMDWPKDQLVVWEE